MVFRVETSQEKYKARGMIARISRTKKYERVKI